MEEGGGAAAAGGQERVGSGQRLYVSRGDAVIATRASPASGRGGQLMATAVMRPRVPSLPQKSCFRS